MNKHNKYIKIFLALHFWIVVFWAASPGAKQIKKCIKNKSIEFVLHFWIVVFGAAIFFKI